MEGRTFRFFMSKRCMSSFLFFFIDIFIKENTLATELIQLIRLLKNLDQLPALLSLT